MLFCCSFVKRGLNVSERLACVQTGLMKTCFCRYSRLFRLLIGVQRAQASLQSCWLLQSKLAKGALGSCPLMRQLMHLRSHMAHLLDTLQYYLQVCPQLTVALSSCQCKRAVDSFQHWYRLSYTNVCQPSQLLVLLAILVVMMTWWLPSWFGGPDGLLNAQTPALILYPTLSICVSPIYT